MHYLRLVEEASTALWDILHMDGWKAEAGKSLETGTVHSLYIKKYGRKVFRLQVSYPLPSNSRFRTTPEMSFKVT